MTNPLVVDSPTRNLIKHTVELHLEHSLEQYSSLQWTLGQQLHVPVDRAVGSAVRNYIEHWGRWQFPRLASRGPAQMLLPLFRGNL